MTHCSVKALISEWYLFRFFKTSFKGLLGVVCWAISSVLFYLSWSAKYKINDGDRKITITSWLAETCPCKPSAHVSEIWTSVKLAWSLSVSLQPQTHRPFWCRPNSPSPWQTKQSAGLPGGIALSLARHLTFLTQLEFHSYLWGRGTVRGNNLCL